MPDEEDEVEVPVDTPRGAMEVAQRCLVLYAIVGAGHGTSRGDLIYWLKRESLWNHVSPKEVEFLEAEAPTQKQFFSATWRVEGLFSLAWSIGLLPDLPPPVQLCDVPFLQSVLPEHYSPAVEFLSSARLRDQTTISDANEEVYQIHWAGRNAQRNGKPIPNDYNPGIVFERHYALNWLIGYCGQDWDDVMTDT